MNTGFLWRKAVCTWFVEEAFFQPFLAGDADGPTGTGLNLVRTCAMVGETGYEERDRHEANQEPEWLPREG